MKLNSQLTMSNPLLNDENCKNWNKKNDKKLAKSNRVKLLNIILGSWGQDNLIKNKPK
jgi:hypothetical protein